MASWAVEGKQGVGPALMRFEVIRLNRQRGLVIGDRQLRTVQCGQNRADADLGVGRSCGPPRGVTQERHRLLEVALLSVNRPQTAPGAEMFRRYAQNGAVKSSGRAQVPVLVQARGLREG